MLREERAGRRPQILKRYVGRDFRKRLDTGFTAAVVGSGQRVRLLKQPAHPPGVLLSRGQKSHKASNHFLVGEHDSSNHREVLLHHRTDLLEERRIVLRLQKTAT